MQVTITGLGLICSAGNSPQQCLAAFCTGRPNDHPLQSFDRNRYGTTQAFEILDRLGGHDTKLRATRWLTAAVHQAIADAQLQPDELAGVPVLVGTGLRELRSLELWHAGRCELDVTELHFAGAVNDLCRDTGPVVTCSNACAAGSYMLGLAEDMIRLGQAPLVIVAATDSITESMLGLAERSNIRAPVDAVRPFDQDRRGVLLGEGAAALVLETSDHALGRGARCLARLGAVGLNCDAHHETAPDFRGMYEAMRLAYARAGADPKDVNLLFAHGTGTPLNDQAEIRALRELFGERASAVAITALKSLIGHTSGASGLMSVVTAVRCMEQGMVPPIAGLVQPFPDAQGLDFVVGQPRAMEVHSVQVDAFGFGGINAVALIERAV